MSSIDLQLAVVNIEEQLDSIKKEVRGGRLSRKIEEMERMIVNLSGKVFNEGE